MESYQRVERLTEATTQILMILTDPNEIKTEPRNLILHSLVELIEEVSESYTSGQFNAIKALIEIGNIGNQITRAPGFWNRSQ